MIFIERLLKTIDGLSLVEEIDGNYYMRANNLILCLIEPHSGTDYKYCLRADYKEIFDKWGNSPLEEFFIDDESFNNTLLTLNEFIKKEDWYLSDADEDI